jgi:hypothetical protein
MRKWSLGFRKWSMMKGVEVLKKMKEDVKFGFQKVE